MKRNIQLLLVLLSTFFVGYIRAQVMIPQDTKRVDDLNKLAYSNRQNKVELTIIQAEEALKLAIKLDYDNGRAEAHRVKGIGLFYTNQSDSSVQNYFEALKYFRQANNKEGEAKTYNNIGNLYLSVDYVSALNYFNKSLEIANALNNKVLIAGIYLNIGTIYQKQNKYTEAISYYEKSLNSFTSLDNPTGIAQCLQNLSVVYKHMRQYEKAEQTAKKAIEKAKEIGLNWTIASTNLTLGSIYITQNRFDEAQKAIQEGFVYSKDVKDDRLTHDFYYISYTLESKRKNYKSALDYLIQVYKTDSTTYITSTNAKFNLYIANNEQELVQIANENKQKTRAIFLWAGGIVSCLLAVVVFLLIGNVSKKTQTNKKLTLLNKEISQQKEDLDRINHNLEEIIDERTKDLKNKNKKLSEYSSHLSHQIRGPVATIKGLVNLEKEGLIDRAEVIEQVGKCVNEIDDKILNINEMLHDPQKYGFWNEIHKDE